MKHFDLVEGITLDRDARDRIAREWNRLRILAAAPALPMALGVAVLYDATLYLGVALMSVVLGVSIQQRNHPRPAALLALDTFGTWLVVELLGVPPVVLGIPFTVIWVIAWLTTKGWSRLGVMAGAAVAYAIAAFIEAFPVPPPESLRARIVGSAVGAYYVILLFSALVSAINVFRLRQVALTHAKEELERLIASKDEFVASVSHELRTPLTGVVGFASELSHSWDEYGEEERRDMVRLISEQGQDVAEIVDDLLAAARAEAGTLTVQLGDVDVIEVVSVLAEMEGLDVATTGSPTPALADPARLRQVLRNLTTHARRYGGERRRLELNTDGSMLHIRMCDDGPGISGPDPERVFESYERSHEAIGQPGSVGLGLSVARTLARLMGGDVTYHREGPVTVFDCSLVVAAPIEDPRHVERVGS